MCIRDRCDIAYEFKDGSVAYDDIPDPLPFDVNAPVIDIHDDDFGIWYIDVYKRQTVVRVADHGGVLLHGGHHGHGRAHHCGVLPHDADPVSYTHLVFLAFATGTSWGTFSILIPIVCHAFPEGEMRVSAIAAWLSGAVCGDHCSPISDTTIMASAGAHCSHVNHVSCLLYTSRCV